MRVTWMSDRYFKELLQAFSQKFPQIGQLVTPILESSLQPEKQSKNIIDTLVHEISIKNSRIYS